MRASVVLRQGVVPAVFVAAVLATFAVSLVAAPTCRSAPAKQWTVMLYLDGEDTSIQGDILREFDRMIAAGVGSTRDVNVVAQLDRIPGSAAYGGWTEANRFCVTPGMAPTRRNAVADWGDGRGGREVNTADPAVLRAFVKWAAGRYPADRYALVIADHGYGWKGLCIDTTSSGQTMSLRQLAAALRDLPCRLDLLDLDACLMNSIEVAYQLRHSKIDVVVGSEAPGDAWPLAEIVAATTADPTVATEELAKRTCDLYVAANPLDTQITLAAYRMGRIAPLASAVKALAGGLATAPHEDVPHLARNVLDALQTSVFYSRAGSDYRDAHGMSIFFPDREGPHHQDTPEDFIYFYQKQLLDFGVDTGWQGILRDYYFVTPGLDPRLYAARSGALLIEDTVDLAHLCRRILGTPTTNATGGGAAWHRTPVEVTLSALPVDAAIPVAFTEYRVDAGAWTAGTTVTLPAPADHSGDGIHTIGYRSTDLAAPPNVEAEQTRQVKIDTTPPVTTALANAVATRGRAVTFRYRADDALPSGVMLSPRATMTICIATADGRPVKRLALGRRATNVSLRHGWRCTLSPGTYRWLVAATDLAGNRQGEAHGAWLVVR